MDEKALIIRDEKIPQKAKYSPTVRAYMTKSRSEATRRAYRSDWNTWTIWCEGQGVSSLPAASGDVCQYLVDQAETGFKVSTLSRRLASIRLAHKAAELESPTSHEAIRTTMKGIKNEKGVKPDQKSPVTADLVREMVRLCDTGTLKGKRDKAILLLGWAGAFRRSELAALKVSDLEETKEGFFVHLRKSKTDQAGRGTSKAIVKGALFCPVQAVKEWIEATGREGETPLFCRVRKGDRLVPGNLSGRAVAELVKSYAKRAGLEGDFAGHSLRSGFITSAADAGKDIFAIMDISGHKSIQTVKGYVRRRDAFRNNAGEGLL